MLNASEILQTLRMIDQNKLVVRTITMGTSCSALRTMRS